MRRSSCSMSTVPVPAVRAASTRAQSSLLASPATLPPPRKPISNLTLVSLITPPSHQGRLHQLAEHAAQRLVVHECHVPVHALARLLVDQRRARRAQVLELGEEIRN